VKPGTLRGWFVVHEWTSLVCLAFMLLLCITGLPLIFHEEIDHALGYTAEPPEMEGVPATASVDAIIADALARNPGDEMQFVVAEAGEPEILFIRVGESVNGAITAFDTYDARTGELLNVYPLGEGFMEVITRLHVDLFAGQWGMYFLGFMGLLLLVSLVSGAVLYAPFMGRQSFGTVRRDRSSRVRWLDAHNFLGIFTLAWFFILGATGVVHTLGGPIFQGWQENGLARMAEPHLNGSAPATGVSVDDVIGGARDALPRTELSFLAFPGNSFATPEHFVAYMTGGNRWAPSLLEAVLVEPGTGEALATAEMPWTVNLLMVSQPLHYGNYGGMPMKVLWAVLDILTIVLLWTGLVLWFRRRWSRRERVEQWARGMAPEDQAHPAAASVEVGR